MFSQITFKRPQELFASGAILGALRGVRMDSIEIVTSDEQVAGETAAVFERIAGGLGELERLALAFGHLRCVDHGMSYRFFGLGTGQVRVAVATGLCARLLSDLFFLRFQRGSHIVGPSLLIKFRPIARVPLQYFAWSEFLFSSG